ASGSCHQASARGHGFIDHDGVFRQECPNHRCEALKIDIAARQRWPLRVRCHRLHPIERQSCRERFERTGTVLVWAGQGMNLTLWRGEHRILSWSGEIRDWRPGPHQDKLTKFL